MQRRRRKKIDKMLTQKNKATIDNVNKSRY